MKSKESKAKKMPNDKTPAERTLEVFEKCMHNEDIRLLWGVHHSIIVEALKTQIDPWNYDMSEAVIDQKHDLFHKSGQRILDVKRIATGWVYEGYGTEGDTYWFDTDNLILAWQPITPPKEKV